MDRRAGCLSSRATTPATPPSSARGDRGAPRRRVVVVAPYEGPLRDATAGRAACSRPDCGCPTTSACPLPGRRPCGAACGRPGPAGRLSALADELDAEALRNSADRELFTNPAKTLADRMSGRDRRARRGQRGARWRWPVTAAATLLRIAHQAVAAVGLADAMVALRAGLVRGVRRRSRGVDIP